RDVLRAELVLERREIVPGHFLEARQQRAEARRELGGGGGGERAERQPVEAVLQREDARTAGRRASKLDRRLDRLRTGAREQDAFDTRGRKPQQLLGEQRRQRVDAELHGAGPVELQRLDEG